MKKLVHNRKLITQNQFNMIIMAIAIILITFILYLPALNNDFVRWDDDIYVFRNSNITLIDLKFIKWIFIKPVVGHWHPATMFSLAADYSAWGLNPLGYHLTNIFLHCINTFLVFILLFMLLRIATCNHTSKKHYIISAIASFIFGIHPLRVESVAWISERKDVLSALFFLLTIIVYLKYLRSKSIKLYLCSIILFIFAVMSKSIVVTLPLVLLLLDWYPLERYKTLDFRYIYKLILIEKIPYYLISLLGAGMTYLAHAKSEFISDSTISLRILVSINGYIFYIIKTLFPFNLAPIYPYQPDLEFFSWEFILVFIIFAFILNAMLYSKKCLVVAMLNYFLILLPVIGVVRFGRQLAADRYTYLPSIGLYFLISIGISKLWTLSVYRKSLLFLLAGGIAVIFLIKTTIQIKVWKDTKSLWTHQLRIYPKTDFAYDRIAFYYVDNNKWDEALLNLTKAIDMTPNEYAYRYYQRGTILARQGELDKAIADFTEAIQLDAGHAEAYNNRGMAYKLKGNYSSAINNFLKATQIEPAYGEAHYNMGLAYLKFGDINKSKSHFIKAAELGVSQANNYLGK